MGTPDFAVPALKSIYEKGYQILEVYSQPPQKKNRGQKILNSPIQNYAKSVGIPVRCPVSLANNDELEHIKKLKPDIVVVAAYGKILPTKLLDLEDILFINIHASLLPRWRGAAPIQRAIMNKDKETGISIMKIIPELDAGPILIKSKIKIIQGVNYGELENTLSTLGAKLIIDAIELIKKKNFSLVEQDLANVTYAKKVLKSESKINWNESAEKIIAKINALNPNPGCWFELSGSRIKVIKAVEVVRNGRIGTIINDNLTIACAKNAIQILELKKEGKKQILTKEFLKGNKIKIGQNL
jgi:methionyl-tRNA formyltransferase